MAGLLGCAAALLLTTPAAAQDENSPPSANLTVENTPAQTGEPVRFRLSWFDDCCIARGDWDFDGDGVFETAGGLERTLSHIYTTPGTRTVRVRVTDGGGLTRIAEVTVDIFLGPPAGSGGVSINRGARFTNDPNVTLSVVWPEFSTGLMVANDGGFFGAQPQPLQPEVPWTLDSSGAERLPKTVYVRFQGKGEINYTDDIILDETAPRITSATLSGRSLRLRAADATSGLASVETAKDRRQPAMARSFTRTLRVTTKPRWVRVTDHAGNRSGWRKVASRR